VKVIFFYPIQKSFQPNILFLGFMQMGCNSTILSNISFTFKKWKKCEENIFVIMFSSVKNIVRPNQTVSE